MELRELSPEEINDNLIREYGKTAPIWVEDFYVYLQHKVAVDGEIVIKKAIPIEETLEYSPYVDFFSEMLQINLLFPELLANAEIMQLFIDGIEGYFYYVDFSGKS